MMKYFERWFERIYTRRQNRHKFQRSRRVSAGVGGRLTDVNSFITCGTWQGSPLPSYALGCRAEGGPQQQHHLPGCRYVAAAARWLPCAPP